MEAGEASERRVPSAMTAEVAASLNNMIGQKVATSVTSPFRKSKSESPSKEKEKEPEKRDIYTDSRDAKLDDDMSTWDEEKLREVVDRKKGGQGMR